MTTKSKSQPSRSAVPPPVVRPPVTDRSPFAGLPIASTGGEGPALDKNGPAGWSRPALNEIERGAIRRFAEAIGETNPLFFDPEAARAQGYRDVLAPLLFPFSLRSSLTLKDVAQPNRTVLSSDQQVEAFEPICAGDQLLVSSRIAELTQRPGNTGPLEFVVVEDEGRTPEGKIVFRTRRTLIIRAGREQPAAGGI
ncbi:MAG TPA: MaoC family dehydratase N-terminal domain-containing protein [Myxococcales bacterium]|nr:MaoC family dehydratase N-terminal domain-containing protein [Myxococcales bacterium]